MFITIKALTARAFYAWPLLIGFALVGCDVSEESGLGENQEPDPVIADFPIAFIARPLPVEMNDDKESERLPNAETQDILDPTAFHPGAQLILKARASGSAPEEVLTQDLFPDVFEDPDDDRSNIVPATFDIKDLEVSPEGDKLIFALRAPEDLDADEDEQPTWNIWEYDVASKSLAPILDDPLLEQGQDVSPHYLPDGRIVFTSTRQKRTRAILVDEGKSQYSGLTEDGEAEAFNLHIYNPLDSELEQLTFNPSHDLQPTVLSDGRILFLRWDNMSGNDRLSFYTINPDGSQLQKAYGYDDGGDDDSTFWNARTLGNGQILINSRQRESNNWGGDIVAVNTEQFLDNTTPNPLNPGTGEATLALSPLSVDIAEPSPKPFSAGGLYNAAYPLNDGTGRLLVSWSSCKVYSAEEAATYPCTEQFRSLPDAVVGNPNYGLWILDLEGGTQQPVKVSTVEEMYTDPVVLAPRALPNNIASNLESDLKGKSLGVLNIRNVYDIDGALPAELLPEPHLADRSLRQARFIRLVKSVPIPDDDVYDFDNSAFGLSRNQLMRDILGYAPIEPDGSARFEVPANVPFMINLVDATGKRIGGRHSNWISVQAGEQLDCVGCHARDNPVDTGHGRLDAAPPSAYLGAPFTGINAPGAITGQTMAESQPARTPSIDLVYEDIWTADTASKEPNIALTYANIRPEESTNLTPTSTMPCNEPKELVEWLSPSLCSGRSWDALCRITINYEQHIHPIWERDRQNCDATGELITDNSCTHCHARDRMDPISMMPLTPAGNLWFSPNEDMANPGDYSGNNTANAANYFTSFAQLLFGRWQWEINDMGALAIRTIMQEVQVEIDVPRVDDDGNPVLDGEGNQIIDTEIITEVRDVPVPAPTILNTNSAQNRAAFFNLFEGSDPIHSGLLSPSELRLIAEWLDIGAQYYNNPFDAPAD